MIAKNQVKIENVTLSDLRPFGGNPRKISDEDMVKLRRSIRDFGFIDPVIARKSDNLVIGGHQRVQAAKLEGMDTAPVVYVEFDDSKASALNIALNKISGEWDFPKLGDIFQELDDGEFDITITGFDESEVEDLINGLDNASGEIIEDEIPETLEEPISKAGDLWLLGEHRLLCGDSTKSEDVDRLMGGENANLMVTDPPYAIYGSSSGIGSDIADDKMVRSFFESILRIATNRLKMFSHVYVCCDWRSWSSWWEMAKRVELSPKNMVVWDKGGGGLGVSYMNCHELVGFFAKLPKQTVMKTSGEKSGQRTVHKPNLWRGNRVSGNRVSGNRDHNAQKPVELMGFLIENSSDIGNVVLELFSGSGTTIIAAEQLKRKCYAMEIEPKYCDVAVTRWENLTGEKAVLEEQAVAV